LKYKPANASGEEVLAKKLAAVKITETVSKNADIIFDAETGETKQAGAAMTSIAEEE